MVFLFCCDLIFYLSFQQYKPVVFFVFSLMIGTNGLILGLECFVFFFGVFLKSRNLKTRFFSGRLFFYCFVCIQLFFSLFFR
jgi:hypothetical protein